MRLYTPLELAGRNIYIREGCYACHSQMIRTLRDEVERYGPYSLAAESQYDRPMLWGSKRTGPDLARIGGKYSDFWQVAHLTNPRDVVPELNMPAYGWLARNTLKTDDLSASPRRATRAWRSLYAGDDRLMRLGTPTGRQLPIPDFASGVVERYGKETQVSGFDGVTSRVTEMDALVAYLQVLGRLTGAAYQNTAAPEKNPDPTRLEPEGLSRWILIIAHWFSSPRVGDCST